MGGSIKGCSVMNTEFLLWAQYESAVLRLADVAQDFLGMSPAKASRLAGSRELPVPAFRLGSQKSPWFIHVVDLAAHIDRQREEAAAELALVQGRWDKRATRF